MSDLSQIPTSELQAALAQSSPGASQSPAPQAPDLSQIPTSELQAALSRSQGNGNSQSGGSQGGSISRAAQGLLGSNGGRLGCASTACHVLSAAGIPFPMTPNAREMENQMAAHGFVRADPSESDVLFGAGTGPSGRHVMVNAGNGRTIEDPGGSRGNSVQYGQIPYHDATLTGWKYMGSAGSSAPPQSAPDLSQIPTSELQAALAGGTPTPQTGSNSQGSGAALSPPPANAPAAPSAYFSPAFTGTTPDAKDYVDPSGKPDPIGQAFLAADTAASKFQSAPTPENKAAYASGVQGAVNALASVPGALALPQYSQWVNGAVKSGLAQMPTSPQGQTGQSQAAPSGVLPFIQRITGTDGHEGTFHQELDSIGSTASDLWQKFNGSQTTPAPGQTADLAAMDSNAENAGGVLSQMNRQAIQKVPSTIADLTVPGGSRGLIAHGAQAAVNGKLPQFGASIGPGIANETLHNPIGQMMNVVSLVGAAKIPLDIGASNLLGMGTKLSAAADAAEAAGNASSAVTLRGLAQKATAAGQDMKVASAQYGRTITGGKVGDYAANAAATVARKHFPGSGMAEELTNAAMGRSLGKAVIENYPGFKVARNQAAPVNLSQPGDIRLGQAELTPSAASRPQYGGLGSDAPAPNAAPSVPNASVPSLAALLGGSKGIQPPRLATSPAPVFPALPRPGQITPLPLSPAGKMLHPNSPGANGANRHSDGTFAPVPQAGVPANAPDAANWNSMEWRTKGVPQTGSQKTLTADDLLSHVQANGGGVGAVVWDRTRLGKYIPRDPNSGIDIDLHGGPRTPFAPGLQGKVGAAVSSASQGTVLNSLADKTGGTTLVALGDHAMSLGNMEYHKVYAAETEHQIKTGALKTDDLDAAVQETASAILKTDPKAFKGQPIDSWSDYQKLAPSLSFDVRNQFQRIIGGPKSTAVFGTVPFHDVLAGFNDYHDIPTGHVVAALHIHPGQGKAQTAAQIGVPAHPSYPFLSAGRGLGDFDTPFPASAVFDPAVRAYAEANGKQYLGTPSSLNYWLPRGYVSATGLHSGIIKGIKSYQQEAVSGPKGARYDTGTQGNDLTSSASISNRRAGGTAGQSSDISRRFHLTGNPAAGQLRSSSGGFDHAPSIGGRRQSGGSNGQGTRQPLTPPAPSITPDGRQIAVKGRSGTVYLNARAYQDITDRLGASSTSQGVALRQTHVQQIGIAFQAASQEFHRRSPRAASTPEGKQYLADLQRTANLLRQGLGTKAGLPLVKIEPGQTLSQTKAVARHERTHVASYDYPLSEASRTALTRSLSQPSHPLHSAFVKAQAALAKRGYTPDKTWDEIPAIISGGPSQYSKAGLSDADANGLATQYAKRLIAEHGIEGVRAVFAHGSSAARQVAKQTPAGASTPATRPNASPISSSAAPDEWRWLSIDEVTDLRKAGLLSSPKQILKAVAGHGAALATDEIARLPAVAVDLVVSAATGRDRTIGDIRLQDVMQAAKIGATKGVILGLQVMKDGAHGLATQGITNPMLPLNHKPFNSGSRILNAYVNTVFNAHEGAYASLRLFALHRALLEMADIGAINAVRRGLIPQSQKEAFRQHLYNAPSDAMMGAAVSAAEEATLTNGNKFSEMYQGAYDKGGKFGRAAMSQVIPFPKIESNVAGRSLEMAGGAFYAPLKFAMDAMKTNGFTAEDQRKFSKTMGRGLVGLGLIALGMMIEAKRRGVASDEKHHQPGQIIAGGRSYPTNTVGPPSNMLQLGIDIASGRDKDNPQEGHSVGDAVANLLMEQPWVAANPGDLTQVLTSGKDAKRQLGQQAGSYVPSFLADAAAQGDKYKRKQTEPLDYVKNRVPFLRNTLPIATDSLGNPRLEPPNRLFNPFGGTPRGASDTPAMTLMQQALSNRRDGVLSPSQQATSALRKSILSQAAAGKDIRPALTSALGNHQLSLPAARQLLLESRETPLQQRIGLLPLSNALDVFAQASPTEKMQLQRVIVRKLEGAARSRSLMPQDLQKAQALGIVPRH